MNHITSPATGDTAIEQEIKAKGKTAPRVTPADIEANIASEHYFTADQAVIAVNSTREIIDGRIVTTSVVGGFKSDGGSVIESLRLLTFCVLVLQNGFTVTGESACASPENFDAGIGRKVARANAVAKIYPLMGYELKTELARPVLTEADAAADLAGKPRPGQAPQVEDGGSQPKDADYAMLLKSIPEAAIAEFVADHAPILGLVDYYKDKGKGEPDFLAGKAACDLSGEKVCEACQ